MKWYKIYLNGENRIWKKCITYSWEFIYEDKEINFQRIIDSSSSERYQIKALIKGKGLIAKSISGFGQIRMPEFAEVSHLFLVREDILNINELSSIKGISLKRVSVYGDFPLDYMAIIFNEVIDCVDNIHSKREEFECMSTLVLDMSNYEKLKRYVGQTFLSLAKRVETEDGEIITPPEGTEYRCVDIGLKMNSDGVFLIMEGADGVKVEAFPIGDEVYEFVSTKRISLLKKQYGDNFGKQIAFRKVDTGMTKEMVVVAWGEPYRKSEIKKENGTLETWSFSDNRYVELLNGKVLNVRVY